MRSVFHRTHAGQFLFDALIVVVGDVLVDPAFQFVVGYPWFSVIHLLFQEAEEIFHGCVVGTRPFSGHALEDLLLLQRLHPGSVLIMPALVGMNGGSVDSLPSDRWQGLMKRFHDEVEGWSFCHTHPDNFAVIQVHDWTQIKLFLACTFEFGDVCRQFLQGMWGGKPAVHSIFSDGSDFALIRFVARLPNEFHTFQRQYTHEPLNFLVIDDVSLCL